MRETSKYTRRTVNKVMETLPSLYLDLTACRQGLNGSQQRHGGSLEWEKDEFDHIVDLQVRSQEQDPQEKRRRFIKLMILNHWGHRLSNVRSKI